MEQKEPADNHATLPHQQSNRLIQHRKGTPEYFCRPKADAIQTFLWQTLS